MERRKFLKYAATSLAGPFLFQGQWMNAIASPKLLDVLGSFNSNRKLVLIQLNGGNDGLNMVIPISQYDNLANARRNILVNQSQILKLTDETGLNPAMPQLANLYHEGKVQIIQGVGYPNTNFSHFRSRDIVMSASGSNTVINSGWAGRMFSQKYPTYPKGFPNEKQPHPIALTIGSTSSSVFEGEMANYSAVLRNLSTTYDNSSANGGFPETPFGNELRFVNNMMEQTESYLSVIKSASEKAKNLSSLYPSKGQNPLADQLKLVANLIAGGLETQIYLVSLGGWDTHSGQVSSETNKLTGTHPDLLNKLSTAIEAFQDDLTLMNKADEVMGYVFTEFGRRIKSNGSLGTDHGTSWPAILFGSKVNPGILGNNPVIPSFVGNADNLEVQYDFRSIYAGLYKQWFNLDDQEITQILGQSFPGIQLVDKSTGPSVSTEAVQSLKLWPNPVDDQAQFSFEADGERTQISIFSINGQRIENLLPQKFTKGYQQVQLQLGHLAKGTYLLVLQQSNSQETVKFVVR